MKYRLPKLILVTLAAMHFVPSIATATDLTDVPMAVKNTVLPNIMFTLDDSGSMHFEVIPESSRVYLTFPRPGSSGGRGTALYGTEYYSYGTYDDTPTFDINNKYARCYRNSSCNSLYYDPTKRYLPWSNSDGSLRANATASAAWFNPDNTGEGTLNLTSDRTFTRYWVADSGSSSSYSLLFYPATYFRYTGSGSPPTTVDHAFNVAGNYTRVEIKSDNAPFPKSAARTDCSGTTCSYTEEIQNFANWFSYYRSRILMARAGAGRAFAKQGTAMRVGFGAINKGSTSIDGVNTETIIRGVRAFTGTDRSNFFSSLYGHTIPAQGTPLRYAMDKVGQYFKRSDSQGPWDTTPGTYESPTQTQHACRQNYHILMTDGYWNGNEASTSAARNNVDNTNFSGRYTAGNPFSDSHSNTLADVAMYYWVNDLRSDMNNTVVPPNVKDPATWQHMVNFTVGLGVYGTIAKSTIDAAFTAINSSPPVAAPTIVWPAPCNTCTAQNVDDLAHAALNSRGNFFSASDPDSFAAALTDALDDIVARTGSAAAVAVANANVSSGDNAAYASSYNSGSWTGDLNAYSLDLTTGVPSTTSLWTSGTAQAQLDLRTPAVDDRFIVTYSGSGYSSSGRQFQPSSATTDSYIVSKLSPAQTALLNTPSTTDSAAVIAYLRGDQSGEAAGTYRFRSHLLGDIINAEPVVIRAPQRQYVDSGYAAFKVAQASRTKMVVQPANDGMVHVLNATTGAENWAYIPNLLINTNDPTTTTSTINATALANGQMATILTVGTTNFTAIGAASNTVGETFIATGPGTGTGTVTINRTSVLNMLSRKTYAHRMYIDATPFVGDVDFTNTAGATGTTPDWRTILVGGLGKGGRGVYALDVTTPIATSEADAAGKVLWEFPNASTNATVKANIGYVFGRPVIVKTKAKGWVVLVASGYNNGTGTDNSGGDGHGYLFVLNARTGELIKAIDTTTGNTTDPSGLAHLAAFVADADYDNTVSHVYSGDLKGNVWRFDLTHATDSDNWTVKRLAILKDGALSSSNTQPITTEPQLAMIKINGIYKRFVYVGTGRYLGDADVPTTGTETVPGSQKQTFYGLLEDLSNNPSGIIPVIAPTDYTRNSLQMQSFSISGTEGTASTTTVDYSEKKGWYIDLQDNFGTPSGTGPSERVSTNPALVSGALIFTSNIPSADPCVPGGSSWLNVIDYQSGGKLQNSTETWSKVSLGNALASRPVVIRLPGGAIKVLTRTSTGETITSSTGIPTPSTASRRGAWREIPR